VKPRCSRMCRSSAPSSRWRAVDMALTVCLPGNQLVMSLLARLAHAAPRNTAR
jgi:hypothetical protein